MLPPEKQSNGRKNHQEAPGTDMCPVKALAHVVHTILKDGGTTDKLLCAYNLSDTWKHVYCGGTHRHQATEPKPERHRS